MKKFNFIDTITSPRITEKATSLSEHNKIVFKVHNGASKKSIKKSIEKRFKVNVIKVNTINQKTSNNGVTIDNVILKSGNITADSLTLTGNL